MVGSGSVTKLAELAGVGVDARRFRMLVEVSGLAAHAEDGWVGREVRVGDALVRMQYVAPPPRGEICGAAAPARRQAAASACASRGSSPGAALRAGRRSSKSAEMTAPAAAMPAST